MGNITSSITTNDSYHDLIKDISTIKYEHIKKSYNKYEDNIGIHHYYITIDQFNEIFIDLFGKEKCYKYFNIFINKNITITNTNIYEEYEQYGTWKHPDHNKYVEVLQLFSVLIIICEDKYVCFDEKMNMLLHIFQLNTLFNSNNNSSSNGNGNDTNNYHQNDKVLVHKDTMLNMIESCLIGLFNIYSNTNANNTITPPNTKAISNSIVDSIYIKTNTIYDGLKPTSSILLSWYNIKANLLQQSIVIEFLQNFIDIMFFPGLLSQCNPHYDILSAEFLVKQNFPVISKMNVKGSFSTRLRQSKVNVRKKNCQKGNPISTSGSRWSQLSDIVNANNNSSDKEKIRNEVATSVMMKVDHCLEILTGNNCTITNCPEWESLDTYNDSLHAGLEAFSINDNRLTRELFLKFSASIISFNTIDKLSQQCGLIYKNHQQILLLLYLSLIKTEVTAKEYDAYNAFIADHHDIGKIPDGTINRTIFIDYAIFFHNGQVLLKEMEVKMGYNIMDFIDPENGTINEEKIEEAIRDLFAKSLRKRTKAISDFSKLMLEEHVTHIIEWVLSDIRLMKSTSSFFVIDLKEKVNKVCDYISSIEKSKV